MEAVIDRRRLLTGTVAAGAIAALPLIPTVHAAPDFHGITLADFKMLPCGQKVKLSRGAVEWAKSQAQNWGCTPHEMRFKLAQSFAKGTWPYEYQG